MRVELETERQRERGEMVEMHGDVECEREEGEMGRILKREEDYRNGRKGIKCERESERWP